MGPPADTPSETELLPSGRRWDVRGFRVTVLSGPNTGEVWDSSHGRCSIGSRPPNDLVLGDRAVSRMHCELVSDGLGVRVRDLGSKNGTVLDGVSVVEAEVKHGSVIRVGQSSLRVEVAGRVNRIPLSVATHFGSLVAVSPQMRAAFAELERVAAVDTTVLIEGETGTGKDEAARSVHEASARRDRPFVVIDCGSIPPELIESELFGHERGAFTGADASRDGAFARADTGTIFLDEIGELPLEMQPRLLRALEQREVRPVGATDTRPIDVRIIAATNRDLRAEVNEGHFRADLYFRLAVIRVILPPLRVRPDDLPSLVERLLTGMSCSKELHARLTAPEFMAELGKGSWRGNVRELRNFLERCVVYGDVLKVGAELPEFERRRVEVDASIGFHEARRLVLEEFERSYLESLLQSFRTNLSAAARHAGIGRATLYNLLNRHGLR